MKYRLGLFPVAIERWPNSVDKSTVVKQTDDYELVALNEDTMIWRSDSQATKKPTIFKMYYGRGPVRWWHMHRFAFRVEREYRALFYLAKKEIPCSKPVGWTKGVNAELGGRFEVLVTEEVPNAVAFSEVLHSDAYSREQKQQSLLACMKLAAKMHQVGFHHGAFYVRNILMSPQPCGKLEPFIIDTDRAMILNHSLVGDALAEIDLTHFFYPNRGVIDRELMHQSLLAYGMDEQQAQAMQQKIRAQSSQSKHTRNYLRAYAMWRELRI